MSMNYCKTSSEDILSVIDNDHILEYVIQEMHADIVLNEMDIDDIREFLKGRE